MRNIYLFIYYLNVLNLIDIIIIIWMNLIDIIKTLGVGLGFRI